MKRLLFLLTLMMFPVTWTWAQTAPQVPDSVVFKDTRTAFNGALAALESVKVSFAVGTGSPVGVALCPVIGKCMYLDSATRHVWWATDVDTWTDITGGTPTVPWRLGNGSPNARDACLNKGEAYFQMDGGPTLWVCTAIGSPGVWQVFAGVASGIFTLANMSDSNLATLTDLALSSLIN